MLLQKDIRWSLVPNLKQVLRLLQKGLKGFGRGVGQDGVLHDDQHVGAHGGLGHAVPVHVRGELQLHL